MYSFDLEPVSVERIDALEGKVRDLQKEVEKLQQKLEARDADDRMEILHAQGTGNLGNTLLWTNVGGATTSFIRIVYPGAYQVVVVVNCELNGSQIKLMKGTECIQLVYCGYADRFPSSTTLTCITRMEKGDQLSVVCTASLVATNRLTLCFHELLVKPLDKMTKTPRSLQNTKGDRLILEIYVNVQVLMKYRTATFTFDLGPVSVERIDILESKVQDLQREVKCLQAETASKSAADQAMQKMISDLRAEMNSLREARNPAGTILARATSQLGLEGVVLWRCEGLKVTDGVIRDLKPGVYQDGKLCIWLEDCESKKQWCTARRSLCDYVDLTNAIPTASAADYVKYFHDLIDANHDGVDSFPITLQPLTGNNFQLQIVLKVQVMGQPRVATYTFTMEPISLERFDVMESKVRDLKSEVSVLRSSADQVAATHHSDVQKLQSVVHSLSSALKKLNGAVAAHGPALQKLGGVVAAQSSKLKQLDGDLAYLNSASKVVETLRGELSGNGAVSQLRDEVEALRIAHDRVDSFCLRANCRVGSYIRWGNIPDGVVEIQTCGTFYVSVMVNYQTHFSRDFIHLIKGRECLQSVSCGYRYPGGDNNTASLVCIARLEQNDQIAVHCPLDLLGISYMALLRVDS
ncbi:hypothetical protein KRP22_013972 [Phytophthora ramorum]|nr:hypothetical protein KRP22_13800 [Phytophthora ramorum]